MAKCQPIIQLSARAVRPADCSKMLNQIQKINSITMTNEFMLIRLV